MNGGAPHGKLALPLSGICAGLSLPVGRQALSGALRHFVPQCKLLVLEPWWAFCGVVQWTDWDGFDIISLMIPDSFKKYFWDTKLQNISLEKNADYIIERILEMGDLDAFGWLSTKYPRETIVGVLERSRRITPKTGNFYAFLYNIPNELLACFQKPFIPTQNQF